MQQLAVEQRRLLGPRAPWHVGDVAWGLRQHEGRESEWTFRLWRDGDRVVAWSWLKRANAQLEVDVLDDRRDLLDEILAEPDATHGLRVRGRCRAARCARAPWFRAPRRARCTSSCGSSRSSLRRGRCRTASTIGPSSRRPRRTRCNPPRGLGALARHRVELRERDGRVAVSQLARLRRRGARRPLCGVLPDVAGRRERRRRARAGRRARGVPPARPGRRSLHVRAPAPIRGGRPPGDRLLRIGAGRALYESIGFRIHATIVGYSR